MVKLPNEIVTDTEVERVHGYSNFGDMTKRAVVDQGVLTYAFGFTSGHTQMSILQEHGLIRKSPTYSSTLTKKGFTYLRAMFFGVPLHKIMELRSATGDRDNG